MTQGVFNPFINGGRDLNLAATPRESATERSDSTTRKGTDSGLIGDGALVDHGVVLGVVEGVGMFGHGGAAFDTGELGHDGALRIGLMFENVSWRRIVVCTVREALSLRLIFLDVDLLLVRADLRPD